MLIQTPPRYSVALFGIGYLLFWAIMAPLMDAGDRVNLTITFVVALAVSLAHAHYSSIMLKQQKQIVEINAKLQELVYLDPLTGLLNKTTIECRAEKLLHRLQHGGSRDGLTLFLLDLDAFKGINDQFGHPCGDYVLVQTAESMRRAFPDAAGLGRTGGDEFAVLYDRALTEKQAMSLRRVLVEHLEQIQWQGQPMAVQCSLGVCICTLPQLSYRQLYTETDRMLYQAKQTGKGQCCVRRLAPSEEENQSPGKEAGSTDRAPEHFVFSSLATDTCSGNGARPPQALRRRKQ